jgi:DNA-binding response OmpR family regulator/HPt (histidine-containing phosphotransfer) domain-containing protein
MIHAVLWNQGFMRILIVEDDELTAQALVPILTHQNHVVEIAVNGETAWDLIKTFNYDLMLLDVAVPDVDGVSLCRRIRARGLQTPILLLTDHDSCHEKAIGLDAGADDYVVKPFDAEELVARVRALLRRGTISSQPVLEWGLLQLDPSSCEVTYNDQPLLLTPKEYALLELFLRNSRRVFSCGVILEHLWAYEETPGEEAVRTHIKGLRQKLKAAGAPGDLIETVYGIGYRLKALPSDENLHSIRNSGAIAPSTQQRAIAQVNAVWCRFKERVQEQIAVLEQAAIALLRHELTAEQWQQARQDAHSLAGSLGTFGFPEASQLARQIEQCLQQESPLDHAQALQLQQWAVALRHQVDRSPTLPASNSHPKSNGQSLASPSTSQPTVIEAPPTHLLAKTMVPDIGYPPRLLIVDCDRAIKTTLKVEATYWGLQVEVATDLIEAQKQVQQNPPDAVLLDPAITVSPASILSWVTELSQRTPPIPVIIFTWQDNLEERLEFARMGGRAYLTKSATPAQVFEVVTQVLHQADRTKTSILVVDDDLKLLALLRSLLEPWGLKVTTLADPTQFWDVLEATAPDLVLLDIEMPDISGTELCQVVRNAPRWSALPIVILTAHTDPDTVNQVFAAGADDFITKPIAGPDLVRRIMNRLERMRLLRSLDDPGKTLPHSELYSSVLEGNL